MADTPLPGLVLRATLRSKDIIGKIAWSPDGRFLAAALSYSNAVYRWDATTNIELPALIGHNRPVTCVAWAPDGQMLASGAEDTTIHFWNVTNQQTTLILRGHADGVRSVAWSPDGQVLASGSKDTTVRLWATTTGQVQHILEGHERAVNSVVWSPDGHLLASGAEDTTVRIWDPGQGQSKRVLAGHTHSVLSVAWAPAGRFLASAAADKTVRIWDTELGRQTYVLEGHTGIVTSVSFSADGRLLASKDTEDTVRIWRTDTWEPVALFDESSSGYRFASLSFHPIALLLATSGEKDFCIHTWEIQNDVLLGLERGKAFQVALVSGTSAITPIEVASGTSINMVEQASRSYTNAKVVLVGDSGVGKTALSLVLTQKPYEATDSSYSRHVWIFERDEQELEKTHETMLWDLAGQPGFRLIHQLYLTDVAVALVVFDARSEIDPFAGVRYWDRALLQAQNVPNSTAIPMKKFLVAARTDRGGIPVNRKQIDTLIRKLDFDGYFETSAKEGLGIQALTEAIRTAIDWQVLPTIQSNELFQQIKDFLVAEKQAGRFLSTSEELYRNFLRGEHAPAERDDLPSQFKTCIALVESGGLVRCFSFGNLVLLQPELLDAYASALIMAARNDPDGMGCIPEDDTRQGLFPIPEDVRIRHPKDEELLLIATIEDLLRHEIALREQSNDGDLLVFPSQLTFEREDAPEPEGKAVAFTFEGAVLNIYATLAVRLAHSGLFRKQTMWKNATTYAARVGGVCGMVLAEIEEGRGELTLFFDQEVTEETRFLFDEYVHTHLQRRALPEKTRRRRIFACSACTTTVTDQMVRMRRERGYDALDCPVCGTHISLLDGKERLKVARTLDIHEMDNAANAQREREMAKSTLAGKQATNDFDIFLCYDRDDEQAVKQIDAQLLERGVWPWLAERQQQLAERQQQRGVRWQDILAQDIEKIKTVAVFVGKIPKVPWQNGEIASFLRKFIQLRRPVILVVLGYTSEEPFLPKFLQDVFWVDFRKQEPDPVDELIEGITGERVLSTYKQPNWRTNLRKILVKHFSEGEFQSLCVDIGVDYAILPGSGQEDKARELIGYCERHDRVAELVNYAKRVRPKISWKLPENFNDYE